MKLARMPDGSPEIFHTLQGEGRSTGRPSVFIRASLCNLSCRWCDTAYTWNWEDTSFEHESGQKYKQEEQILDYSIDDIIEAVQLYNCSNYVLTGGEPLLQEKAWVELMKQLPGRFEVETNGTLFPGATFLERIDQLNVSPKLSNSGVPEEHRIKTNTLTKIAQTSKADFKFVIGNSDDLNEAKTIINRSGISPDHVFLMPKASSVDELESNQDMVATLAQEHGFHYSDRLHLRLYGAKRGV